MYSAFLSLHSKQTFSFSIKNFCLQRYGHKAPFSSGIVFLSSWMNSICSCSFGWYLIKAHFNFVWIVLAAGFISFQNYFFQIMQNDWVKVENVPSAMWLDCQFSVVCSSKVREEDGTSEEGIFICCLLIRIFKAQMQVYPDVFTEHFCA